MKTVKLTPKASQDLEDIWFYGYHHFGEVQADKYINHISDIFRILGENSIGTPRPELGEYINALPFERHIIYFLQTDTDIIIIPILSQHQDAGRHLNDILRYVKTGRVTGVYQVRIHVVHPLLLCSRPFRFDPVCPGITPILPKTVKQRSGLALSGFGMDLWRKRILYAFGFTRNNAG